MRWRGLPILGVGCTDLRLDEPPNRASPPLDSPFPTLLVVAFAADGSARIVFDRRAAVVVVPPVSPHPVAPRAIFGQQAVDPPPKCRVPASTEVGRMLPLH